jgi:hypothetical protein
MTGALGARLAARMGVRWLLVLTNGVAMLGFLVLTHLPASGGRAWPRWWRGAAGAPGAPR